MSSKHILLYSFLSSTLILSGCGDDKGNKDASTLYSTNAQMSAVADLDTAQRAIATRICYAYQSKNSTFRSQTYMGGTFSFNIKSKDCANTTSEYVIPGILTFEDDILSFKTDSVKEFEDTIQTSQSGYLTKLCKKIQNNNPVSNTTTENGVKAQIIFSKKDDLDSYTLQYFSPSGESMVITGSETFKVRTQFNTSGNQILGMDESYSRQDNCAAGSANQFSDFTQNYSSFKNKQ